MDMSRDGRERERGREKEREGERKRERERERERGSEWSWMNAKVLMLVRACALTQAAYTFCCDTLTKRDWLSFASFGCDAQSPHHDRARVRGEGRGTRGELPPKFTRFVGVSTGKKF